VVSTLEEQVASADLVFVGEVLASDQFDAFVKPIKVWKGRPASVVPLRDGVSASGSRRPAWSSCSYTLRQAERHLLFAKLTADGVYRVIACTPSAEVAASAETMSALDRFLAGRIKWTP
jgi:hypothetical protein